MKQKPYQTLPEQAFDHAPVSEGMQHGPIAPPELHEEPVIAEWMMNEAEGDLHMYELLMRRSALLDDIISVNNSPIMDVEQSERLRKNHERIQQDINRYPVLSVYIPRARQSLQKSGRHKDE